MQVFDISLVRANQSAAHASFVLVHVVQILFKGTVNYNGGNKFAVSHSCASGSMGPLTNAALSPGLIEVISTSGLVFYPGEFESVSADSIRQELEDCSD